MYPSTFFNIFPPFPRDKKVFVAMSFDKRFDNRWNNVIKPSIESVEWQINDESGVFLAERVDARRIGDSILTEILNGISSSALFFADITTIGHIEDGDSDKRTKAVRNANVMYEVGLAHATRLPEEVLIYRSDNDEISFDMANMRVNFYDPDGRPGKSQEELKDALLSAFKGLDLRRHLSVQRVADSMDYTSMMVLAEAHGDGGIAHPWAKNLGAVSSVAEKLRAIERLLNMEAIRLFQKRITIEEYGNAATRAEEHYRYVATVFGNEVLKELAGRTKSSSPDVAELITKEFGPDAQKGLSSK